jgi:phage shock protein A
MVKFDELENRIESMEAEADLVNYGKKSSLEDEIDRLSVDEEIEKELLALKGPVSKKDDSSPLE